MAFSINSFNTALAGGIRPNQFSIEIPSVPTGVTLPNFSILCKAGAVPGMTIGTIEVPFRGRRVKYPGDRTFAEWTITVINQRDQAIRAGFEAWSNFTTALDFTTATISSKTSDNYKTSVDIKQLADDGAVIRTYQLREAFVVDVGAIELSYDTTDSIEEFTVTFQYSYFV
ncbi:hypothetical protein EBU71_05600 [bacterium]|jgi:T4-like virus tail tube protein gp19|nr:hypothetical protein [Candidatus Elulimicrobium humile]